MFQSASGSNHAQMLACTLPVLSCGPLGCSLLLEQGADINAEFRNGGTALHWAAERGNLEMVKQLLDPKRHAKVMRLNVQGLTPWQVSRQGQLNTVC
jgi:ankyrin repeat protein